MAIDHFWKHLLTREPDNVTFENESIDVVLKDCYVNFDTTACVRNSLLFSLGLFTLLLCFIRILRLHVCRHPQIHQYLIFYSAFFEVIFLIVEWRAFMSLYKLEFAASFLKMIQFVLLWHYHWTLASRILHNRILRWLIMPLLGSFFCFCLLVTVLALMLDFPSWIECLAPHWLVLSFSELLCIQLYVIAGIYVTKKINSMRSEASMKWQQKRDLWSVIGTYEFSAVASVVYYLTLQLLGDREIGCSGVFAHVQEVYSPIYAAFMVIRYLSPIWIMIAVFHITRGYVSSEEERLLGLSFDGSFTSTFNTDGRFQDNSRQLTFPVPGSANLETEGQSSLKRSTSSPALLVVDQHPTEVPVRNYGSMDPCSQSNVVIHSPPKRRSRHDSGMPSRHLKERKIKILPLNQCSEEIENLTPSSEEQA